MGIIPHQSEKCFVTGLMKTVKHRSNLIRFNSRQLSEWIRTNPKPSFQSESFWPPIHSDWFGLVRIHSDSCLELNRIRSDRFFTACYQTSYKTFFGSVRIQISEWIWIVLIGSEWIPIRYFRQGTYRWKVLF